MSCFSGAVSSRRAAPSPFELYLPLRIPCPNGDHAVMPTSNARAIGKSSRSGVRSSNEYSIVIATNGDQPCNSASVLARATCHAGKFDTPT